MGARAGGLGTASSCLQDEWSLFNNIAGLAAVENTIASIAYDKNPALPGGDRMAACFVMPSKYGTLGAGFFRFGNRLYNEQILTSGFSNQFGLASLGGRVSVIQYNAEGFGTRSVVALSFGGITELTPAIKIGAYIINLNQPIISYDNNERLPTLLTAGVLFDPIESVSLTAEIEKDLDHDPIIKAGLEYRPLHRVFFRTGFNLTPNAAFFGTGFHSERLKLNYSIAYSTALGTGHQLSAGYIMTNK